MYGINVFRLAFPGFRIGLYSTFESVNLARFEPFTKLSLLKIMFEWSKYITIISQSHPPVIRHTFHECSSSTPLLAEKKCIKI